MDADKNLHNGHRQRLKDRFLTDGLRSFNAVSYTHLYADLHLGKLRPQTPEYRAYVRRVCAAAEKRLRGRLADGGDPADELLLLREAGEFL